MWKPILNCGKQLTIHSRVREKTNDSNAVYEIVKIEFDFFKLKLVERNNQQVPDAAEIIALDCKKLLEYGFEVLEKTEVVN
jgi:hypothetical protein